MKVLTLLCILLLPFQLFGASLNNITLASDKENTVITLTFSRSVGYDYFTLKNPHRMVFDFDKTTLRDELEKKQFKTALVKGIRADEKTTGHLRLVMDVPKPIRLSIKNKLLAKGGYLVQITMKPKWSTSPKLTSQANKSVKVQSKKVEKVARDVIIEIDPGHGGKDPGATGQSGHQEKNIVLSIAKRLKRLIDKTPGMRGKLTRHGDYYVGLRKRLMLAREDGADVFISIHADAYKNRLSHGVSVFALSQKGATSEAARWLAEKENYSELGGVDLSELDDKSGLVRSVLIDLSQTATIGASLKLGEDVLENLDNLTVLHHDGVEQARFVVLKSPDIPSILIETGFISNRDEEKLLANGWYQEKVAKSILKGIKHYFDKHPPRHSFLAKRLRQYRVVRGDSLSKIAKRFHVPMKELKKMNHLSSSRIAVGQLLMLPARS